MIARVFDVDADKAFGGIVAEYAYEVFQEAYDQDLLRRRLAMRRVAAARVKTAREHDERMINRLEKMSEFYEQNPPTKPPPAKTPKLKAQKPKKTK